MCTVDISDYHPLIVYLILRSLWQLVQGDEDPSSLNQLNILFFEIYKQICVKNVIFFMNKFDCTWLHNCKILIAVGQLYPIPLVFKFNILQIFISSSCSRFSFYWLTCVCNKNVSFLLCSNFKTSKCVRFLLIGGLKIRRFDLSQHNIQLVTWK